MNKTLWIIAATFGAIYLLRKYAEASPPQRISGDVTEPGVMSVEPFEDTSFDLDLPFGAPIIDPGLSAPAPEPEILGDSVDSYDSVDASSVFALRPFS